MPVWLRIKYYANTDYVLQYGSPLILDNTTTTIQNIVVTNITGGTQYTLTAGAGQITQFTQAGDNVLSFTVNLSDGNSYTTHQVIQVEDITSGAGGSGQKVLKPIGPNCTPTNELIESDIPFQGYSETQATTSFADYHIYYHTQSRTSTDCERVLRKPIIVLDGFDRKDERKYYDLYKNYLINNDNGAFLGDDLRDKGYDVIILNFPVLGGNLIKGENGVQDLPIPADVKVNGTSQTINAKGRDGGADYIERNAFLLVKLIQQVNATLAANSITEEIVIIGPSMGGQISRYALAYMEKKQAEGVPNMDHNTRLWVSFDSPHDGANIPLTFQETFRFFGTTGQNVGAKDAYESKLRSPGARQLLIEQLDGLNSTAPFHQTYYNNLRSNGLPGSNGYPQNLRKITLANGAGGGAQTYWDGAEVLNGEGRKTFLNAKLFELINNFMPSPGVNDRITKARVALPGFLSLTVITEKYYVTNTNNRGSMDAVQGGTNNTAQLVYEQFYKGLKKAKVKQSWSPVRPDHCFIPTISALGFKNPNFNWNTRVDDRDLVACVKEIYFDNYYIPISNQAHVYLNTANINWLTQEIEIPLPSCVKICSPLSISGNNSFCTTSNSYTVNNLPAGAIVHWSVTPSGIATPNTPDATQTTITANSSGNSGFITLTATITNACNQTSTVSKSIRVGNYSTSGIYINGPTTVSCGDIARYFTTEYPGVSYVWTYPNSWDYITGQYTPGIGFRIPYYSAQSGDVSVTLYDVCGTNSQSVYVQANCGGYYYYSMSPNPASSTVTIAAKETTPKGEKADKAITDINIYDQLGNLKKHEKFNKVKKATLNVSGLNKGVYFVEIVDGTDKERQQLLIQ